MPFSSLLFLT